MKIETIIIKTFLVLMLVFLFILVGLTGFFYLNSKRGAISYERVGAVVDSAGVAEPYVKSQPEPEAPVAFLFFGDMMLDRNVGAEIKKSGLSYLFEKISGREAGLFKNQDIVAGNLEGAVTDGGAHYAPKNSFDFAFAPELVGQLKNYGFNFFNLANNHFSDQGQKGIDETRKNLDELSFNYSGCPDGQIGECSVKIVQIKDKQIGLIGFSTVYSLLDKEKIKQIVADAAQKTDFVIVQIHWGVEYQHAFGKIQQDLGRALVDGGADIVIGHHPHVVQGMEIYNNRPIFYSLGNFIFDQYFSEDTQEGLAIDINLYNQKMEFVLFPFQSSQTQPELKFAAEKDSFLAEFIGWSRVPPEIERDLKAGKLTLNF